MLYDVSSRYYTGQESALIRRGYSRDGKPGEPQIVYGLLCNRDLKNTKVQKHFALTIEDDSFSYRRLEDQIAAEAVLDGLYVVRMSLPQETLSADETVSTYKDLSQVEWAFRSLTTVDLQVRPIYQWKDDRIRSHVFLCMLA